MGERETTVHARYEVGCGCCGVLDHYQLKADALDECERAQRAGHKDVKVYDRMARRDHRAR